MFFPPSLVCRSLPDVRLLLVQAAESAKLLLSSQQQVELRLGALHHHLARLPHSVTVSRSVSLRLLVTMSPGHPQKVPVTTNAAAAAAMVA